MRTKGVHHYEAVGLCRPDIRDATDGDDGLAIAGKPDHNILIDGYNLARLSPTPTPRAEESGGGHPA